MNDEAKVKGAALATLVGGGFITLGSFLPWITFTLTFGNRLTATGLKEGGDGVLTLILGIVVLLIGLTSLAGASMPTLLARTPIPAGIIVAIIGIANYADISSRVDVVTRDRAVAEGSIGAGIYCLLIGAGLTLIGGISLAIARRTTSGSSSPLVTPAAPSHVADAHVTPVETIHNRTLGEVRPGDPLTVIGPSPLGGTVEVEDASGARGFVRPEALQPSTVEDASKTCPQCAERIRLAARVCRYCGYSFESESVSEAP